MDSMQRIQGRDGGKSLYFKVLSCVRISSCVPVQVSTFEARELIYLTFALLQSLQEKLLR